MKLEDAKNSICLVVLFSHPEGYPPTLNAIELLAKQYCSVIVIYLNRRTDTWLYPNNVQLISVGKFKSFRASEQASFLWKLTEVWRFIIVLRHTIQQYTPKLILAYDAYALMACAFIKVKQKNNILWYHNHDVLIPTNVFSLSVLARKMECSYLPKSDIVSLPANERKQYFPINEQKQHYFLIPNYPLLKNYPASLIKKKSLEVIRLIFMGAIGPNHGLEEILYFIQSQKNNKRFELVLKGVWKEEYKQQLLSLAEQYNISNCIIFIGFGPYSEVPFLATTCHIGIGIHAGTSVMEQSLSKSSNKLYEYAAAGLPVLLYDNLHFRKHFNHFEWVRFTNLSNNSIYLAIKQILNEYEKLSANARLDFEGELNFEKVFLPVLNHKSLIME